MSETTICPYCNSKLRIAAAPARTRIKVKCRVCNNRFHPSQILASGEARWLNNPLVPPRDTVESSEAVAEPLVASPIPEVAHSTPQKTERRPPPDPASDTEPEDPEEQQSRRPRPEHRRSRSFRHDHSHRKRVSAALVGLLLFCGAAAMAVAAWAYLSGGFKVDSPATPIDTAPPTVATEDLQAERAVLRKYSSQAASRIIGIWDIRADDERYGWYEFRDDGAMISRAWTADVANVPTEAKWFIFSESGDDIELEIGQEQGAIGNMHLIIQMTSRDAFTLKEVKSQGHRRMEANRFVRRDSTSPKVIAGHESKP